MRQPTWHTMMALIEHERQVVRTVHGVMEHEPRGVDDAAPLARAQAAHLPRDVGVAVTVSWRLLFETTRGHIETK